MDLGVDMKIVDKANNLYKNLSNEAKYIKSNVASQPVISQSVINQAIANTTKLTKVIKNGIYGTPHYSVNLDKTIDKLDDIKAELKSDDINNRDMINIFGDLLTVKSYVVDMGEVSASLLCKATMWKLSKKSPVVLHVFLIFLNDVLPKGQYEYNSSAVTFFHTNKVAKTLHVSYRTVYDATDYLINHNFITKSDNPNEYPNEYAVNPWLLTDITNTKRDLIGHKFGFTFHDTIYELKGYIKLLTNLHHDSVHTIREVADKEIKDFDKDINKSDKADAEWSRLENIIINNGNKKIALGLVSKLIAFAKSHNKYVDADDYNLVVPSHCFPHINDSLDGVFIHGHDVLSALDTIKDYLKNNSNETKAIALANIEKVLKYLCELSEYPNW